MVLEFLVYPNIKPVAFSIPLLFNGWHIDIRWYALAYIAGILLGWWYVLDLAKRAALWGRETTVPWAFVRDPDEPLGRHPSQLYEATLEGMVLFIILRLATHRFGQLKKPGAVTGLFLMGYGAFRMAIETVREPDQGWLHDWPLGLTMGMVLSFLMFAPGVWLVWRSRTTPVEAIAAPAAEPAPEAAPEPQPAPAKAPPKAAPKAKAPAKPAAKPAAKAPTKPKAPPKAK